MVTPIGKEFRKLRIDHDLSLRELAADIEVSPALLSAVETGKRNLTPQLFSKIASRLNLSLSEQDSLKQINTENKLALNINGLTMEQYETGNVLARELANLDSSTLTALKDVLNNRNK